MKPYRITDTDRQVLRRRIEDTADRARQNPRNDRPVLPEQVEAAYALALDMLTAAARHGISPEDLANVTSVALGAWDAIRFHRR